MQVYDNFNPQILKALPTTARRVLEIGCDTGRLGEAFKNQYPGVHWTGVDINPDSVSAAVSRIDQALICDANGGLPVHQFSEEGFDCIVYGDVLEHLVDPWQTLVNHVALLKTGGFVVACIPNIHHWSVVLRLVSSQWQYQSKGILDKTHLRFFGQQSIQELFEGCGLTVIKVKPLIFKENNDVFLNGLKTVCEQLGVEYNETGLLAFQYIFIGQKNH